MPAIERSFAHTPPPEMYLDTNIALDYMVSTRPHHARVVVFFNRLSAQGGTTFCVSPLTWLEFAHVVARQSFRDMLPISWQQRYRLAQWQQASVRQTYLQAMLNWLEDLLDQFGWNEVALTAAVRRQALVDAYTYSLDPHDAAHVASMREAGVVDLLSFDAQFRRVDGIVLWNDLIFQATAGC